MQISIAAVVDKMKGKHLYSVGGCGLVKPLFKSVCKFFKNTGNRTAICPVYNIPWHISNRLYIYHRDICTSMFTVALLRAARK